MVAVRAEATLEEGWFYEGAGIYRHVWLDKTNNLHVAPFGTFVSTDLMAPYDEAVVRIETNVGNYDVTPRSYSLKHTLLDADGQEVTSVCTGAGSVSAKNNSLSSAEMKVTSPHLWSPETPYLYTVQTDVIADGKTVDSYTTRIGMRHVEFDADKGFPTART